MGGGWDLGAMFDGVTAAIPGGKRRDQVEQNCAASNLPKIDATTMEGVRNLYETELKSFVHQGW